MKEAILKCKNCGKEFTPYTTVRRPDGTYAVGGKWCCCIRCTDEYFRKEKLRELEEARKERAEKKQKLYPSEVSWKLALAKLQAIMDEERLSTAQLIVKMGLLHVKRSSLNAWLRGTYIPTIKNPGYIELMRYLSGGTNTVPPYLSRPDIDKWMKMLRRLKEIQKEKNLTCIQLINYCGVDITIAGMNSWLRGNTVPFIRQQNYKQLLEFFKNGEKPVRIIKSRRNLKWTGTESRKIKPAGAQRRHKGGRVKLPDEIWLPVLDKLREMKYREHLSCDGLIRKLGLGMCKANMDHWLTERTRPDVSSKYFKKVEEYFKENP